MVTNKILIILGLHFLLITALSAANPKTVISIMDVEFVEGKTQEKVVEVQLPTSFHGKKKVKKEIHKINSKTMKDNKSADKYIAQVSSDILVELKKNLRALPSDLSGTVKIKLQIQADGRYDVLFVDGTNMKLMSFVEKTLSKFRKFSPIPDRAGQGELQLIIPISFKTK